MENLPRSPDDSPSSGEKLGQELTEIFNSNKIDSQATITAEHTPTAAKRMEISELLSPPSIERRVGVALETCDFKPTPELREGLKDYYVEHYSLATLVDSVLVVDPAQMNDSQKAEYKMFISSLQIESTNPDDLPDRMDDLLKNGRFISDREVSGPLLL